MPPIKRSGFYSFHYKPDHWRVQQIGALDDNAAVSRKRH